MIVARLMYRAEKASGLFSIRKEQHMKKWFSILVTYALVASICISLSGCLEISFRNDSEPDENSSTKLESYEAVLSPREIEPFSTEFTSGMNRFGFQVLLDLYEEQSISVSPASLELAMLMTSMGATGNTKEEMMIALQMSEMSDEEIRSLVGQLMWRVNTNGMEAANALFPQKDYGFADAFLDICTTDFMADIYTLDYINEPVDSTKRINDWGDEKTHGKIPKILNQPLDSSTRLVLANALYFLGDWVTPFEANHTYDDTFFGAVGESTIPFMHAEQTVLYMEGETYQMIILPFLGDDGMTGPFAMSFMLPKNKNTPEDVARELSESDFADAIANARDTLVRISLPKFEFEYETSMVETMKRLGMEDAFNDSARFDKMTDGPNGLFISDILHKTYVRIDEEGAEAAAITTVIMAETAMPIDPEQPVIFNADSPFLFSIFDTTDGTILFTGITATID